MKYSLKDMRQEAGLTQEQAASAAGISQMFLSQIETGSRNLAPGTAGKLSRVYLYVYAQKSAAELQAGKTSAALKSLREYIKVLEAAPLDNKFKAGIKDKLSKMLDSLPAINDLEPTGKHQVSMKSLGRDKYGRRITKEG